MTRKEGRNTKRKEGNKVVKERRGRKLITEPQLTNTEYMLE